MIIKGKSIKELLILDKDGGLICSITDENTVCHDEVGSVEAVEYGLPKVKKVFPFKVIKGGRDGT